MPSRLAATFVALVPLLAASTFAQTGDTCADPLVPTILEPGADLDDLTSSGLRCDPSSTPLARDAFFHYTLDSPGSYRVSATGDGDSLFLAAYEGATCGGACLGEDGPSDAPGIDLVVRDAPMELLVQIGDLGGGPGADDVQPRVTHLPGDLCSFPVETSGEMTYSHSSWQYHSTAALAGGACAALPPGLPDLFLLWTALEDGDYWIGQSHHFHPSAITAYDATVPCGGACVGYAAPIAGAGSRIFVPNVVAGDRFLLQVSQPPGSTFPEVSAAVYLDDCQGTDALEPNDLAWQAPILTPGLYPGLSLEYGIDDEDFYRILVQPTERVRLVAEDLTHDHVQIHAQDFGGQYVTPISGTNSIEFVNTEWEAIEFTVRLRPVGGSAFGCAHYALRYENAVEPCYTAADDAYEPNADCTNIPALGEGAHLGLFVHSADRDLYSVTIPPGATLRTWFERHDPTVGLRLRLYAACDGTVLRSTPNSRLQWENTSDVAVAATLEVKVDGLIGAWVNACTTYDLFLVNEHGVGSTYCAPAVPNSTGTWATLRATGTSFAFGESLTLIAERLPHWQFAMALCSRTQGFVPNLGGGAGTLCLGAPVLRFNDSLTTPPFGTAGIELDTLAFPEPPLLQTTVAPGETWYFQVWYRDAVAGAATSNLTNGVQVLFR